jgi:acyl-CoA synthetase (AMP-forming)/AMP-acid ligase II
LSYFPDQIPSLARLDEYVEHYCRTQPDVIATSDAQGTLTYAELGQRVACLAASLRASGVARGDRVAVHGSPCADGLACLLAIGAIGAIYVGLNPKHQPRELAVVLGDAQPALILLLGSADTEAGARVLEACAQAHVQASIVGPSACGDAISFDWDAWAANGQENPRLGAGCSSVSPRDPAAIVYTSGSTGAPKGAMLLHRGLVDSYRIQANRWFAERPVMISELPINHLGWVGDHCAAMIVAGGSLHFLERYSPEDVLAMIESRRANYWFTITTMLLLAMRSERWPTADLTSLRRIVWAGAAAPRATVRSLLELGIPLATCYGMTETTGNVTYTDADASLEMLCESVGRPVTEFEVRVVDEHGRRCAPEATGEVQVRGDVVFGGYFRRPEATEQSVDQDGWLHTGDLAVVRSDGNLSLTGRSHDMFKSGGYNVYPREIELVLERHPDVAQAVVVSVEHELWGEVGHAFVQPRAGAVVVGSRLREWCRGYLANYKVPKRISVREAMPMLAIGKVDKQALRDEARGR